MTKWPKELQLKVIVFIPSLRTKHIYGICDSNAPPLFRKSGNWLRLKVQRMWTGMMQFRLKLSTDI